MPGSWLVCDGGTSMTLPVGAGSGVQPEDGCPPPLPVPVLLLVLPDELVMPDELAVLELVVLELPLPAAPEPPLPSELLVVSSPPPQAAAKGMERKRTKRVARMQAG